MGFKPRPFPFLETILAIAMVVLAVSAAFLAVYFCRLVSGML
jgi:uncharacterized protein YoxC